jgi:hypothetical protein
MRLELDPGLYDGVLLGVYDRVDRMDVDGVQLVPDLLRFDSSLGV